MDACCVVNEGSATSHDIITFLSSLRLGAYCTRFLRNTSISNIKVSHSQLWYTSGSMLKHIKGHVMTPLLEHIASLEEYVTFFELHLPCCATAVKYTQRSDTATTREDVARPRRGCGPSGDGTIRCSLW